MSMPFVPIPVPMDRSLPVGRGAGGSRARRALSLGGAACSWNSWPRRPFPGSVLVSPAPPPHRLSPSPSIRRSCSSLASSCPPTPNWEEQPVTPTVLGHEVMEERAKFTVYKILVRKSQDESWVIFRRYTDFARLNDKLKDMFPGFRLSLPPKRWFKDNYNPEFLEERKQGLQAFLQNLVAHKDVSSCLAVREFLCLDDPPGPFDSLEESRAFCETLEEGNYRLQKELTEKQSEISTLKKVLEDQRLQIGALERRLNGVSPASDSLCTLSGQGSETSVEVNRDADMESSVVEADQETGSTNSFETQSSKHSAGWCGPPSDGSPPSIPLSEGRLGH